MTNQLIIPQITGYGLKGFEDNSDHFKEKLFAHMNDMKVFDKTIGNFSLVAGSALRIRLK